MKRCDVCVEGKGGGWCDARDGLREQGCLPEIGRGATRHQLSERPRMRTRVRVRVRMLRP